MRKELDTEKRNEIYKELQAAIRAEMPYIFLLSQKERIAIHKKFDVESTGARPGYWMNGFKPRATL
jgi:ABC-type transport system substrate-binding protein